MAIYIIYICIYTSNHWVFLRWSPVGVRGGVGASSDSTRPLRPPPARPVKYLWCTLHSTWTKQLTRRSNISPPRAWYPCRTGHCGALSTQHDDGPGRNRVKPDCKVEACERRSSLWVHRGGGRLLQRQPRHCTSSSLVSLSGAQA